MDIRDYLKFVEDLNNPNREQAEATLDQAMREIVKTLPICVPDLHHKEIEILSILQRDIDNGLIKNHFRITDEPNITAVSPEGDVLLSLLLYLILAGKL